MMLDYLARLIPLLALVCGLAVLSLWLYRRFQPGLSLGTRERAVRVVDAVPLGPMTRLVVAEFAGKRILLAVSRGRVDRLAESEDGMFKLPDA
jgi:flagellar protein FliO/FliZ